MSVEPGIVDTNVLVYALDADAPQHEAARALREAGREASTTLFVSSQILCEFYSIVTNPAARFQAALGRRCSGRDFRPAWVSACAAGSRARG
jgi:predicted nucleic acid-binding protein